MRFLFLYLYDTGTVADTGTVTDSGTDSETDHAHWLVLAFSRIFPADVSRCASLGGWTLS